MARLLLAATVLGAPLLSLAAVLVSRSRPRPALRILAGVGIWLAAYLVLLLTVSLSSSETILSAGAEKRFCSLLAGCELAASVTAADVRASPDPGRRRYSVTLRIASLAQHGRVAPARLSALVADARGRRFPLSAQGPLDLEEPLRPGAAYQRLLVFDLPQDAAQPRLLLTEGIALARALDLFLIADEDSFLHRRVWFQLPSATPPAEAR